MTADEPAGALAFEEQKGLNDHNVLVCKVKYRPQGESRQKAAWAEKSQESWRKE